VFNILMKLILAIIFSLCSLNPWGQWDFVRIDEKSKTVPDSLVDYKEIAVFLTKNLENETEKARAIYVWIAHNIQYDLSYALKSQDFESNDALIEDVLKRGNTICSGYSILFHEMGNYVGLKTFLINGYTKDSYGRSSNEGHAWNGVVVDGEYYLIDVTWSAGYVTSDSDRYIHEFMDRYFMNNPEEFILNHIPYDPLWQFLNNPISHREFYRDDFSKLNEKGNFFYKDSIPIYQNLNELEQVRSARRRILSDDFITSTVQEGLNDCDILEFNCGLDEFNRAIGFFNLYFYGKRRNFSNPDIEDADVRRLLERSEEHIMRCLDICSSLKQSEATVQEEVLRLDSPSKELYERILFEKEYIERLHRVKKPWRIFVIPKPYKD